jgi:hypothetical protein
MDFQITAEAEELQTRARRLAEDFATRAATHDREASSPMENYAALQREGFYEVRFRGSRYSVNVMPALTPMDIVINSAETLLRLRDIVLARSEEEVCREIVLRVPVSERLRLEIAQQALEMDDSEAAFAPTNEPEPTATEARTQGQMVRSEWR